MIVFAEVSIGTGMTTPCTRCNRVGGLGEPRPSDAVAEEVARIVETWSDGPGPNVSLVGLEPFVHPELPAIVEMATRSGVERLRLSTDAGALARGGNAEGVIGAGVRHIEVVVLGGRGVHDDLCARPGLLDAARAGTAAFTAAAAAQRVPVAVTGLVPVCPHNAERLPEAVAALVEMGVVSVSAIPLTDTIDPAVVAIAEQIAVTSGVWLHVPGVSTLPAPVNVKATS